MEKTNKDLDALRDAFQILSIEKVLGFSFDLEILLCEDINVRTKEILIALSYFLKVGDFSLLKDQIEHTLSLHLEQEEIRKEEKIEDYLRL